MSAVTGHPLCVVTAGKPIMYEKSFLQDIAVQNSSKYAVPVRHTASVPVCSVASLTEVIVCEYDLINAERVC